MQELSSSQSFGVMRLLTVLPETCPLHPDEHLVQLPGKEPFCRKCAAERIREKNNSQAIQGFWIEYRRGFHDVLNRDSIFDDPNNRYNTFDSYQATEGTEAYANKQQTRHIAGQYLDRSFRANTILTGNPGAGKTHLAMAMLTAVNEHIQPDASCLFVSVNELIRRIKDSFNNRQSIYTEAHMTHLLGMVNLLVLDDLGSEASFRRESNEATDWVQQVLFGILNKRHGRTIITTNLTSKQLTDIYNPKLLSRMYLGVNKHHTIIKFAETDDMRKELY
ncbi:MAG: ATP-binding protein [Schleiferilactobacillus perolens]|jgi:DNA replication protein DnaC|uniref:ATP-binding protein n=1 Tax=Schleiferilactobacillus perolens TaxID=100468 RepID=UPI0039ECFF85|nr:ATP-binding protein [Schleiferilactobacillus harbinensis]